MKQLAPIVIFAYNRSNHLKKTIDALRQNKFAKESELIVYADGPKQESDIGVAAVRDYLTQITGFKTVTVHTSDQNLGLASSIITGVTSVLNRYEQIIVLEDDIVTSPYFLTYMNAALDRYQDEPTVWHISGWNFPLLTDDTANSFLWRVMNCWGWGTWADRWHQYSHDAKKLIASFTPEEIMRFNVDSTYPDFWQQLVLNQEGRINTWAIYWYATIFKHQGLCLNPTLTYTRNIGFDGSGEHSTIRNDLFELDCPLNPHPEVAFPDEVVENTVKLSQLKQFFTLNNEIVRLRQEVNTNSKLKQENDQLREEVIKLESLNRERIQLLNQLNAIYASSGWRWLTKGYRVRDRLLPQNSTQRQALKTGLSKMKELKHLLLRPQKT